MMKTQVEIQNIQDPDGIRRSRFTIAFQDAIKKGSLNKQLLYFQEKYLEVILECKNILNRIKESRKNAGDSILKWQLADIIVTFLNEVESSRSEPAPGRSGRRFRRPAPPPGTPPQEQ